MLLSSALPGLCALSFLVVCSSAQNVGGGGAIFPGANAPAESDIPTTPPPPPTEFIVYDSRQMPCVLVKMNMKLIIEPRRTGGKKFPVPVPKYAMCTGSCGDGEDSRMDLTWSNSFKFVWHFQKSRVSDAWYIDNIKLSYNTSDRVFANSTRELSGEFQQVHSSDPLTLFLTPIGYSYSCKMAKDIKLFDDKKASRVTVRISRFQIQPFAIMTHRQYGDEFKCPEEAGRADDSVPFFVGMLLAMSVLGTIGGYAGYRHFKVKKFEYDTIE